MEEKVLYARNMRRALTGAPESEKEPMRFCKGKLDNGFPCRIVMIGDEDYCTRHRKEIEALEAGAPMPVNRIEREVEGTTLAKFRCVKKNCTRAVKEEGEMCWQHKSLEDQVEAGAVSGAEQPAQNATAGQPVDGGSTAGDKPAEKAHAEAEGVQAAAAGNTPPPLSPTLQRLLQPVTPSLSPTSIVVDFTEEEFAAIEAELVTSEDLRDLTLLLIAGKLGQIVQVEDPCAKSRRHAAD